jgi:hypothetical protein
MTVTNILVILHIKTGNAVVPETANSPAPLSLDEFSIQFPIKGIEVLSCIPQQTHGSEQSLQTLPVDVFTEVYHQLQTQAPRAFGDALGSFHGSEQLTADVLFPNHKNTRVNKTIIKKCFFMAIMRQ